MIRKISMRYLILVVASLFFFSCSQKDFDDCVFELLDDTITGIDFKNSLVQTEELNIMTYLYYFNGAGVATGDFNNDGLPDLFFVGNMNPNKLYLNEGDFKFKDVSDLAGINKGKSWSTGVSIVDINNDGLLDIYVSQVGDFKQFKGKNQLFVCREIKNGVPIYSEQADQYGLGIVGFSTQSAFFDFDLDGDLDMYQLSHSVHENGTFGERSSFMNKYHEKAGDKLFRNDNNFFVDVTKETGIYGMVIGYGLGIVVGDVNNDGWPDIYVGNDFHENDYLYVNQKNGKYKECAIDLLNHTSRFSMGVDMGDINNDAELDIVSVDMHPFDPIILKSSLGEDDYSSFNFKLTYGYNIQFARNNLQLNNGNGTFSEIAMYSNVHATDWSWAPLFFDYDNDGLKDLFISNGIAARMNDIDYVNFRDSDEDHKWKTQADRMESSDLEIIKKIPSVKIYNQIFKNSGDLRFSNVSAKVINNEETFSNGAIYVDLDNDGFLDVVTNNINSKASIYKNVVGLKNTSKGNFASFRFLGSPKNLNGIGTTLMVFKGEKVIKYEKYPTRGFLSSMNGDVLVGLGDTLDIDSVFVIWPDLRFQKLKQIKFNTNNVIKWDHGLPKLDLPLKLKKEGVSDSRMDVKEFVFKHKENDFVEFDRERLIPFMVSREGPGAAVGDLNGDGLDDVFFGSSKRKRSKVYLQDQLGTFVLSQQNLISDDSLFEDVDAKIADLDDDGDNDIIVASGGNEFWGDSEYLKQRIYLNDGKGSLNKKIYLPNASVTASKVALMDYNKDGHLDVFVAGRATPKNYGIPPSSYLFKGTGDGTFIDVTKEIIDFDINGMVTDAVWCDIDLDNDPDLILSFEWGNVIALVNQEGKFSKRMISDDSGLWTFVLPFDFDRDGDVDLIAGNHGLNSKLKATKEKPVGLLVNDFDENGQTEQIMTYYVGGIEVPFATHAELMKQIPSLKKKYLLAKDFAATPIRELFGVEKIKQSIIYKANNLANCYFENVGNNEFKGSQLPDYLQFSALHAAVIISASANETKILIGGNTSSNSVEMGFFDADFANILTITKEKEFKVERLNIKGQIVDILPIKIMQTNHFLIVRNNSSSLLLSFFDNNGN